MIKVYSFLLVCFCLCSTISTAQTPPENFQADPKQVMEEIFKAARTKDFSKVSKLCIPNRGDGDVRTICGLDSASKEDQQEFITAFKKGKITGEIIYTKDQDGTEYARVPFWFKGPSVERSNETMRMIKRDGKWYLLNF